MKDALYNLHRAVDYNINTSIKSNLDEHFTTFAKKSKIVVFDNNYYENNRVTGKKPPHIIHEHRIIPSHKNNLVYIFPKKNLLIIMKNVLTKCTNILNKKIRIASFLL